MNKPTMYTKLSKPPDATSQGTQAATSPDKVTWPGATRVPVWSSVLPLQAKLTINQPGDAYEQEADRVAERVTSSRSGAEEMRMPAPAVQRCGPGCGCAACTARQAQEELVQTKQAGSAGGGGEAPAIVHNVLRSPGRPLEAGVRAFMEPRFGRDFGDVRVHTDGLAAQSAQAVDARAYTVGPHVVFGPGQYAPHSPEGRRLLAHELTHVVQQQPAVLRRDGPASPGPSVSMPGLTTLLFRYGDASLRVELPTSVTASLPVALRGVGLLTISLSADIPTNFSFSVALDARPHLRISTRLSYNRETGQMSAGLVLQSTTTTCTIPDPTAVQRDLQAAGDRLTTAIRNFLNPPPPPPPSDGEGRGLSLPPEIERARELGTAIYNLYDRAQRVGAGQRCVTRPVWSLEFGARVPLQPPPSAPPIFGGEERERQPAPHVGGTFTWHF